MPGAFHFKHTDGRPIKWRVLAPCALTITSGCLGVTHWVLGHIPRANVPLALEYVMMLGWVTGLYLTLSATTRCGTSSRRGLRIHSRPASIWLTLCNCRSWSSVLVCGPL